MTRTPPPGSWCTVVIRLRPLSNGTSAMRGNRVPSAAGLSPTLPAAASSAVSVGSPTAVQSGCPPAGGRSAASLHSAAAVSRPARSGASPARTGWPARVTWPPGPYPVPLISACPAGVHRRRATMFPSVKVPVLSVPRTVTEPSVSTAGSRLISALRADIRRAPSASARVTTAGSDSGTAATTRLIAAITISSVGWPRASPSASTIAHSATATAASTRPTPASRRCSGVSPGSAPSSAATRPIELAAPVAVTTARPRPRTTTVPADTTSPRPPGPAAVLSTGTDSPVSAASSTSSAAARPRWRRRARCHPRLVPACPR